jgi:hypothetical protein
VFQVGLSPWRSITTAPRTYSMVMMRLISSGVRSEAGFRKRIQRCNAEDQSEGGIKEIIHTTGMIATEMRRHVFVASSPCQIHSKAVKDMPQER